jgi:hypothetical protein
MSEKNTGGPAYPSQALGADGAPARMLCEGMTLRDYFAGQALVGILAGNVWNEYAIPDCPEAEAYRMADAMLQERDK